MTNLEFYKDELDKLAELDLITIRDGKLVDCNECIETIKNYEECFQNKCIHLNPKAYKWLTAEHKEEPEVDWSKVKVDTPILVSKDGKEWQRRHFAYYDSQMEIVAVWSLGQTSWTANDKKDYRYWEFAKLADVEDAADEDEEEKA